MPQRTTNLNLIIYTAEDGETSFNDYWKSINLQGDGTTVAKSALQLIDDAYGTMNTQIQTMQQTINAMPDEIYNRIARLINSVMEGNY